jgi:quinol monooxygenase YgiN
MADQARSHPTREVSVDRGSTRNTEIELTVMVFRLEASDPAVVAAALSSYVVATRGQPGNRNVDFCSDTASADAFMVIEKWDSGSHHQAHFESPVMVRLAESCRGALRSSPRFELLESISAHDLA